MQDLSELVQRKFVDILDVNDYEIETDSGWSSIGGIGQTVEYEVWELRTSAGHSLRCADSHIVFLEGMQQVFVEDLVPGDRIITDAGLASVVEVTRLPALAHMYDVQVDDANHRYWTGGILSHNTSIINAICYALYNKPFDQISLQRLINTTNDVKNTLMEVRLSFAKGPDEYEIYRCRGENFTIQVLKNGEDITLDSVTENDRLVQEIIGISYDLFTKVIIFSGNSAPFLTMPVSQQRQQIEELFNITLLAEKAARLKEVIKTTETNISIQSAVVKEQEAQIALYNKQVKDAQHRVEKDAF